MKNRRVAETDTATTMRAKKSLNKKTTFTSFYINPLFLGFGSINQMQNTPSTSLQQGPPDVYEDEKREKYIQSLIFSRFAFALSLQRTASCKRMRTQA